MNSFLGSIGIIEPTYQVSATVVTPTSRNSGELSYVRHVLARNVGERRQRYVSPLGVELAREGSVSGSGVILRLIYPSLVSYRDRLYALT